MGAANLKTTNHESKTTMSEPNLTTYDIKLLNQLEEKIAQLTKERDELKARLDGNDWAVKELYKDATALRTRAEAAEAKCAEMRDALGKSWIHAEGDTSVSDQIKQFTSARLHALSDQCGVGWLSPAEREKLEAKCAEMRNTIHQLADIAQNNDIDEMEWSRIESLKLEACK